MNPKRKLSIRIAGNTLNPVLMALRAKGYRLWIEPDKDPECEFENWNAEKDGRYFSATNPEELLGLVAMQDVRGDDWQAKLGDSDIYDELLSTAYPEES